MSAERPTRTSVAIVGGGSAGLCLALLLADRGVECTVLEREERPRRHSRAIGLHPPALELLSGLGIAGEFVRRGVRVRRGVAFGSRGWLGDVSFAHTSAAYPFVLTLPQHETEALLEAALRERAPGNLRRGVLVDGVRPTREGWALSVQGRTGAVRARFLIGADGARSFVRGALGVGVRGGSYPDAYLMGDFADTTAFGSDAAIFLTREGVVESFPLPGGVRRWVARTPRRARSPRARELSELVLERTGHFVPPESCRMLSAFSAERFVADRTVVGTAVLLGDAARVISPIGGQGMNLAWLDAQDLAGTLPGILRGEPAPAALGAYARRRRRAAFLSARAAEFNMLLGRPARWPGPRDSLVRALLGEPLSAGLARLYAMRWLQPE